MPIYEYACDACDNQFEVKQKFSDPPVETCPNCGKSVRKLISVPGIVFKGTGWYVTDYSNKFKDPKHSTVEGASGEKKGEKADGAVEKTEAKSGEGKTESQQSSSTESSTTSTPTTSSSDTKASPSTSKTSSSST
ncbi:MAG: hypothetical protein GKS05_02920 [Nitrospirales bacterium]|nr:hypothetical protein [Nitrospirales bacterium]